MANVATMVVKIDADITSLTKNLDKGQKAVLKAAENVSKLGTSLSLFVTAPAIAAGGALAKFAADAEASATRMTRTFGPAAQQMQGFIENLRSSVPETTSTLNQMASETKNLADNLGLTAPAAVQVSQALLALAGDMAAFHGDSSIQPAMDALEKGLAGQTRGLAQYGIVVKETDVQQEAYREGLLGSGRQLTETGRAIAAYNLIMQRSSAVQGEAARTVNDAQRQFAFLKSDLVELGEQIGGLLLPAVVTIAKGFRDLLQWISSLPGWVKAVAIGLVAFAATVGPILKLYAALVKIQLLFAAMEGAGWLASLATPMGIAIVGFAALAGSIYLAYQAWKHFHDDATQGSTWSRVKGAVGAAGQDTKNLFGQLGKGAAGNSPLDMATGSPMEQLEKRVSSVADAYKYAGEHGQSLNGIFNVAVDLNTKILHSLRSQGNVFDENTKKLRDMADQLRAVIDAQRLAEYGITERGPSSTFGITTAALSEGLSSRAGSLDTGLGLFSRSGEGLVEFMKKTRSALSLANGAVQAQGSAITPESNALRQAQQQLQHLADVLTLAGASATNFSAVLGDITKRGINPTRVHVEAASQAIDYADGLALRKALLDMPDYFNAADEAAVAVGEALRNVHDQGALLAAEFQSVKIVVTQLRVGVGQAANEFAQQFSTSNVANSLFTKLLSTIGGSSNSVGGEVGGWAGNLLGSKKAIGGTIGGWLGGAAGPVTAALSSALGSAIGNIFGSLFGGKSQAEVERDAVTKANTQALQQLSLKLAGFTVNANSTLAALQGVNAFLANPGAVLSLTSHQTGGFLGGDLQSQLNALTPFIQKAGLTLQQFEQVVQESGLNIFDKDGRIVESALQQLTTGLLQAAQAAFTMTNSFQSYLSLDQLIASAKGQNTGVDTNLSSYNSAIDAFIQTMKGSSLISGAPTGAAADTASGMTWWRQFILNLEEQEQVTGQLDPALMGLFQGITDANSAFSAIIDPLNAMTNAVAGATAVFTNLPSGFRAAQAAYDQYLASPIQSPPTDRVGTLTFVPATTQGTTIMVNGDVNVTSTATNSQDLLNDFVVQVNKQNPRGGTSQASLAIKRAAGLVV